MAIRGYTMDRQDYLTRLRKIEGQVRGLQRMIEDDAYCIDVITQIGSACGALQSVALGLLDQHIRHCVMDAAVLGRHRRGGVPAGAPTGPPRRSHTATQAALGGRGDPDPGPSLRPR